MAKVLFIVPPNISFDDFTNPPENVKVVTKTSGIYGAVITDIPLGILSLSAYIKKHAEVETALLDFNVALNRCDDFRYRSFSEFYRVNLLSPIYSDYEPSIIAISSLFTSSYRNLMDIADCCREIYPDATIVAGGGVPTNLYRMIFRDCGSFDALCYGEGESFLLGLVEAEDKKRYLSESPSAITPAKAESGVPFSHDFIKELDEIPFLDYGILDLEGYGLYPTISAYTSVTEKGWSLPVMTSRGCTHRCCFCSSHTVHGRAMRYHSISRIREDFRRLREEYGAKTIIFQDDHFMANRERAFEIINILQDLELTAFFPNSLALYALDRKFLSALKKVGVNQLVLSFESGSARVLREIMHKPLNLDIVSKVADICRELDIYSDVNILIGLPGETKEDMEDSRRFLKGVNANWFRINVATPLVGSEMYDVCAANNYIKGDLLECNYKKGVVETDDFTARYVQDKAYELNLELNFVENPDMRLGRYDTALKGFENAIRAKSDHAFAYYYGAICCDKLGERDKAEQYRERVRSIAGTSRFWRDYLERFGIGVRERKSARFSKTLNISRAWSNQ